MENRSNPYESPKSADSSTVPPAVGNTVRVIAQGLEIYSRGLLILLVYAMVAMGVSVCIALGGGFEYFNPVVRFTIRGLQIVSWLAAYACLAGGLARVAMAPGVWKGKPAFMSALGLQVGGFFVGFLMGNSPATHRIELGLNLAAWIAVTTAVAQLARVTQLPHLAKNATSLRAIILLWAAVGMASYLLATYMLTTYQDVYRIAPTAYVATMGPLFIIVFAACTLILIILTLILVRRCSSQLSAVSLGDEAQRQEVI